MNGWLPCRSTLVNILREKFADMNLTYSIGGQISFDVMPKVRLSTKHGHDGYLSPLRSLGMNSTDDT